MMYYRAYWYRGLDYEYEYEYEYPVLVPVFNRSTYRAGTVIIKFSNICGTDDHVIVIDNS